MTNSYSGNPADDPKDAVRFWIQDTAAPWQTSDEEIDFVLTQFSNPMLAAANVARALSAKYARLPSKRVGDFALSYGELTKNYADLAAQLESQGQTFNLQPYSGGISKADIAQVAANTDRVAPPFRRDQFDNPSGPNNTSEPGWQDDPLGGSE
jgi:hypothetical protein